jgi:hypothetical protein
MYLVILALIYYLLVYFIIAQVADIKIFELLKIKLSAIFGSKTKEMACKNRNESINPKREELTPEKLRELSGLELPDGQAKETIDSIDQFVRILYEAISYKEQSESNENKRG